MSELTESAANVVENVACRAAQGLGGRIAANHVLPYLPMSLGLIRSCLDDMVDGTSVISETRDGLVEYEFRAADDGTNHGGLLRVEACVACEKDLPRPDEDMLCDTCDTLLQRELNGLAERTGWPAQAVYEHEILYHAAEHTEPVDAAALAGHSRYTLKSMRAKLNRLTVDNVIRQELDRKAGVMKYCFPQIVYPKHLYRKNMAVILSHPASVMEEVQIKIVKILVALGLIVLAMFVTAFWGIPFPLLVLVFLVAAPITAMSIWRRRTEPEED